MTSTSCVCAKLRRTARTAAALYDEALAPSGLTVAQYSLLRTLQRAGPSSLTKFAALSGHDRSTLNRTLAPLEKAGFVRSSCGTDQRTRIVTATETADRRLELAEPYWAAAQDRLGATLGADRDALFAMLDRIEALRT
ncbi:MarR family winged helix-turn-helix transcriptional regulator [Sphingosinicella rhizophila]|uniref:MarR family transcriptional regulator n=1 Tax=Sphingosinicella rhizophila TaxID=3050082 RepID=A0ABU3QCA3_9SPHN|nr:MarR family transcriptional regulator [Sphingosinicella sp. GR2756]MDT9600784.1 MarR family transcriptional regulator [Sphingosinicella sp. GR2756]